MWYNIFKNQNHIEVTKKSIQYMPFIDHVYPVLFYK